MNEELDLPNDIANVFDSAVNIPNIVWVSEKSDLPAAVGDEITLLDNYTYIFTTTVDLTGDYLRCGENTVILGNSSENCRIKSTGLAGALIRSVHSLPMRFIAIEAALALDLEGSSPTTNALDWLGVNFVDCAVIGTIKNYNNVVMESGAFLSSTGLVFDEGVNTIAFDTCLFNSGAGGNKTIITVPSTAVISRRFRIIYSSFVVAATDTGISFSNSASVPAESYILDTVNFSGAGTYLAGITTGNDTANKALFINSKGTGIINTYVNGQLYMHDNATATTISNTTDFVNIAGTTTASVDNSRFTISGNRLTCAAVINRKYLLQASLSFNSGNNHVCEFGFYDSVLGGMRTPSLIKATANTSGRVENVALMCIVSFVFGNYIEIRCKNTTFATNITVTDLNMIMTQL